MGATTAGISVAEYRSTLYEPDMDYVDGVLEERNVGEKDHSKLQGQILFLLQSLGKQFGIYPELRIQVAPTRFRIPDVCVYAEEPAEQVPTVPPLLAIEVLSPEDRMSRVYARMDDFIAMGCPCVWLLDPQRKLAYVYDGKAVAGAKAELTHPTVPELRVQVGEIFGLERQR